MLRKILVPALAGLSLLAGVPGARAQEQAVVVNCSFELEWCEALRVRFEASTGLKAAVSRKAAGETMAQLRAEGDNPRFDVWHSAGVDNAKIMRDEGFLDSYQSPRLAELHEHAQRSLRFLRVVSQVDRPTLELLFSRALNTDGQFHHHNSNDAAEVSSQEGADKEEEDDERERKSDK